MVVVSAGEEVRLEVRVAREVGKSRWLARADDTARACISVGFAREVPRTISPLQTTKGHTQVIKIINIGRHEQRVMYAYMHSLDSQENVCVCLFTNDPTTRLVTDDAM